MNKDAFLSKLIDKNDLTTTEASQLLESIISGAYTPSQIGALLTALRMKSETVDEIAGFIQVMRKHALFVKTSGIVIDTCGTGGDVSNTLNISTAVAFVVAATGVKVAKHGNRAASSQCGSADVLEALGVQITLNPKQAEELLEKVGMTFLFAPQFHPAMKVVAQVRHELKIRTIFNFLGPFVNPAGAKRQLIGVPNMAMATKLAKVATSLDYDHLMIVTAFDGMDEISISGKTHYFEIKGKQIRKGKIDPIHLRMKLSSKQALIGGSAEDNAEIIRKILQGSSGPQRDVVVINAAAALYIAEKVKNIEDGIKLAQLTIDSGKALIFLNTFITQSRSLS